MICAVLPLVVFSFDMPHIIESYYAKKSIFFLGDSFKTYNDQFFRYLFSLSLAFSIFIFLISLQREIVKDIEDIKGDEQAGYKTLVIRFGEKLAIQVVITFGIILIILFSYFLINDVQMIMTQNNFLLLCVSAFICLYYPLTQAMYFAYQEKVKKSSKYFKFSMIGGILFWALFSIFI